MNAIQDKFHSLDALRGIAAIAVAVFHVTKIWAGYLAVDFFLVLSGFVLTHSYLYKVERVSLSAFIVNRFARLYPLHLFSLFTFILASFTLMGGLPNYPDGAFYTFIQNLTLTQNIGLNPHGLTYNYPSWSISVEFWINILFILAIRKSTSSILIMVAAAACILLVLLNTGHFDTHYSNYYGYVNSGLVRGLGSFLLGVISYKVYLRVIKSALICNWLPLLELFSLVSVFLVVLYRDGKTSWIDGMAPFVFCITVCIFAFERGPISRGLTQLKRLGEISYSIYLNQITVLLICRFWMELNFKADALESIFIYIVLLVLYSYLTFMVIEAPCKSFFRRLGVYKAWMKR